MPSSRDQAVGISLIVAVALIWQVASFIVQSIEHELHPLLLTFFCNSLFLLYFPISSLQRSRSKAAKPRVDPAETAELTSHSPQAIARSVTPRIRDSDLTRTASGNRATDVQLSGVLAQELVPVSKWTIIKAAAAVAPLWFLAQLCFNAALLLTSVTSNTILSSASSLFTFFLSVLLLGERFALAKLVAVLLTVVGTILVAYADTTNDGEPGGVVGDALTLVAAALYACYTITLKHTMPSEHESDMMSFFAYLGAINTLVFGPIVLIGQLAGTYDVFAIRGSIFGWALLKGLIDNALADYLWSRAVVLVGPTIATVGLSMQVPVAMIVDPIVHSKGWWSKWHSCLLELLGASAILSGFFSLNAATAE